MSSIFYFLGSRFFVVFLFSKFCLVLLLSTFYFLFSTPVQAAGFYFGAQASQVAVGETFEVGVFLNTEGQTVNAIEGEIAIPPDFLLLQDVRDGGTIVSVWLERMVRTDRGIRFSGILPGGYEGTNGYLFSLIVRAKAEGDARIITSDERILLHDGVGTPVGVRRAPLTFTIRKAGIVPDFTLPLDRDPPEPFTPALARSGNLFDGEWFLVFATQDKGSGIDHYEVRERHILWPRFLFAKKWELETSPYRIHDQKLERTIKLKAIDRAGNERIAIFPAPRAGHAYVRTAVYGIVILCVISFGYWVLRRRWCSPRASRRRPRSG